MPDTLLGTLASRHRLLYSRPCQDHRTASSSSLGLFYTKISAYPRPLRHPSNAGSVSDSSSMSCWFKEQWGGIQMKGEKGALVTCCLNLVR
jgi:hypothetical protein